jgi:adenylate cyclase
MAKEIERKFLVNPQKFQHPAEKKLVKQGYLSDDPERTVRIRISGESATLTIKGKATIITRDEFNYSITKADAEELLKLSKNSVIEKVRYYARFEGKLWEVDEFSGENEGLLMAEVELSSETEPIILPDWVEKEVSNDHRFFNSYLSKFPYKSWKQEI